MHEAILGMVLLGSSLLGASETGSGITLSTAQIVSGLGILTTVIAALFWQLMKAKSEVTTAYKDVLPIATSLNETSKTLGRLVERLQEDR